LNQEGFNFVVTAAKTYFACLCLYIQVHHCLLS
jgi:hypothetical protein